MKKHIAYTSNLSIVIILMLSFLLIWATEISILNVFHNYQEESLQLSQYQYETEHILSMIKAELEIISLEIQSGSYNKEEASNYIDTWSKAHPYYSGISLIEVSQDIESENEINFIHSNKDNLPTIQLNLPNHIEIQNEFIKIQANVSTLWILEQIGSNTNEKFQCYITADNLENNEKQMYSVKDSNLEPDFLIEDIRWIPIENTDFLIGVSFENRNLMFFYRLLAVVTMLILIYAIFQFTSYYYKKIINTESTDFLSEKGNIKNFRLIEYETANNIKRQINKVNEKNMTINGLLEQKLILIANEFQSNIGVMYEQLDEIKALDIRTKQEAQSFEKLINSISSFIWIIDEDGKILYANEPLITQFSQNDSLESMLDFLSDLDYVDVIETLKKRDFSKIKFHFSNGEILIGKSQRIYINESLQGILCVANISDIEKKMNDNYIKKSQDLHFINDISKIINGSDEIEETLNTIVERVAFIGNFNTCIVSLVNDENNLKIKAISEYGDENLKSRISENSYYMLKAFNSNKTIVLREKNDLSQGQDAVIEALINKGKYIIHIPLANYEKSFGLLTIVSDVDFTKDIMILLESMATNITISLEKILLYDQLKANFYKTVEAFVTASEIKAIKYTGHSRRVAEISKLVANRLFLSQNEIDEIYITGLLHDIGKFALSDELEDKQSKKDSHSKLGRSIIENVGLSEEILKGIEYHHHDYNAPFFKSSKLMEQPFFAQIIHLVNDFDKFCFDLSSKKDYHLFFDVNNEKQDHVYSAQLFKVLKDISVNQKEALDKVYYDHEIRG